ncbi:hypothetical protein HHI36_011892 [Cryptolaemus montrouzieri]|uniref:Uncharacterized protein n=1 Tax=Cryptolaemus montrouzieri TaxID=559131 RepID=A0ABD2NDP6_9CUCU
MCSHPGRAVTQFQVRRLINEAYKRAAMIGKVVNRLKATGNWPVNRNVANVTSTRQNDSPTFSTLPSNIQLDVLSTSQVAKPSKLDEFISTLNILSPLRRNSLPGKGRGAQNAVELTSSQYENDLETS